MEDSRYKSYAACARFDDELEAYLEGEARPFIGTHAHDCPACGALLADLRAIRESAQALPQEEPPPAVWPAVRAQLAAEGVFRRPLCTQFAAELEAHLEGEAPPFVAAHARECPACGALLADLEAIRESAQALPQQEPSPVVWAAVRAQLAAEGVFSRPLCTQFEAELEAYLEGEARPFVAAHAHECPACGTLLADLEAIRQTARELPQEAPSHAVWANIHARLESEGAFGVPVGGWRQILSWRLLPHAIPLGILASLVVVGTVLTMPSGRVQQGAGPAEAALSATLTPAGLPMPAGDEGTLAQVVSDLEVSFKANESSMAPDLKAAYDKSLVSLDGSIQECLDSLQQEPRNALARDYLLTAYTRKAEVLSSALESEGR